MAATHRLLKSLGRIFRQTVRSQPRQPRPSSQRATGYPGDYVGLPQISYAPHDGASPDPGEIVWGWVPYEEDHSRGKDRPVLIIGRDSRWLLALPMTSVDHDLDARQEASQGRYWVDIGTGEWSRDGRESEVRVDRVVRMSPHDVRRIAGRIDRARFDRVAAGLRRHWND